MNFFKYIFILYFSFFLINEIHAFTDNDGKGAQSTGREDLSFLNVKNSNFKKGKDALKQALKYEEKNKIDKANKLYEKALKYFVLANEETYDNTDILYALGFIYNKVGDLMMSEIYYQEGLSINPKNNLINLKLGELYFNTNRKILAKERLKVLNSCNCQEYINLKNIIEKN